MRSADCRLQMCLAPVELEETDSDNKAGVDGAEIYENVGMRVRPERATTACRYIDTYWKSFIELLLVERRMEAQLEQLRPGITKITLDMNCWLTKRAYP